MESGLAESCRKLCRFPQNTNTCLLTCCFCFSGQADKMGNLWPFSAYQHLPLTVHLDFVFLFYINTFIRQGCYKLIKSDSKDIYNVIKIFRLEKYPENPEKICIMVFITILSSTTVFNIDNNVSWAPNQQIRMISEGSRDTDDWRIQLCHHRNTF